MGACGVASVSDFTLHDLRHNWSSRAAEMGVPEYVRRDILGHSPASVTDGYTHSGPGANERARELVADDGNYGYTATAFQEPVAV